MTRPSLRTFVLGLLVAISPASLAQERSPGIPDGAALKAAAAEVEGNAELTEEQRTRLLDAYSRIQAQLDKAKADREQKAAYDKATDTAAVEARQIKQQLEQDVAAAEGKQFEVPGGLSITEVEQRLQAFRVDLKSMEDKANRLAERLKAENGRPEKIRSEISDSQKLLEDIQARTVATEGATARRIESEEWLKAATAGALKAQVAKLEAELLSRPVRMDLLKAQQDRSAFDTRRLREKIKTYDQAAVTLRQDEAKRALSEVASTEEAVAGAHPAIQELARNNTSLSAEITARTAGLEQVKQSETNASEQALRFENDLENIKRKLDVLGMSEALGKVLREQQQRLPRPLYGRADISKRGEEISNSSLRQLSYEDERRRLRSLSDYVDAKLADMPEAVAEGIREDMLSLARTRRDLLETAIDVESAYLRALGELDFATRRVESAASDYRSFISERLLWIRSSPAFSLDTLKPLPGEVAGLLMPVSWWNILVAIPQALTGSLTYPLLLLIFAALLRYQRRLRALLEFTNQDVGDVARDRFSVTLQAMGLTFVIALTWPLLMHTLGLALDDYDFEGRMEKSVGYALERASIYFLGLEFIRYLLLPQGVVRRHFGWAQQTTQRVARKLLQMEVVFIPALLVAIVANRFEEQEGQSVLSSLALIVLMLALSRFFAQTPSIAQGELTRFFIMRSDQRRSLLGRVFRYFLMILPMGLVVCVLLGFTHTAITFLASLVGTLGLFVGLVILHELGVRWLRIMRHRVVERKRQEAIEAARAAAENGEGEEQIVNFDEPDPNVLDSEGRNLLNTSLAVLAIVGVWGVWSDLLPALGILDSIPLWTTTALVDGVETQISVTPLDIVEVLLVTFVGYVAVQRLPALLELFLRQQIELASGTVYATITLVRYSLIIAFVIIVLGMLGANWGQIQWAVAALSVGIGFGLQEIVANFISGIILLFEQPIRVGDIVTVGETSGTVTRIRMRATTVRDWDGRELLVPNKEFITGRLLNWSLSDQQTRVLVEIGVAYGSDVPKAMKLALDVAKKHPDVLSDPEPFITFDAFGDNALLLTLRCYLPSLDRRLVIASELRQQINDFYNENGVVIAFPQRDVHLNTLSPLEVHVLAGEKPAST